MENWDKSLSRHSYRLINDVGVEPQFLSQISTTIYHELSKLTFEQFNAIQGASPVDIEYHYQMLAQHEKALRDVPDMQNMLSVEINLGLVIYSYYMTFVYFKDNCFDTARKNLPDRTISKRICRFLLANPVRAFRNSIAHGNWQFLYSEPNKQGIKTNLRRIVFFANNGESKPDVSLQDMSRFEVTIDEIDFWQELSRITAMTIYQFIMDKRTERI